MSRIGRAPITVPSGVSVTLDPTTVSVKGPKGELSRVIPVPISLREQDGQILVERPSDTGPHRSMHGLTRTLVANMVTGVSTGFKIELELVGVGFRAAKQGEELVLNLGFSHPVKVKSPEGISIDVPEPTRIDINGIDKEVVGQVAANIRKLRPPEPYKGKGILYRGEKVKRKAGKAGKAK
ncbi:MAG: 50S ribosomal protein L6 [Candidatus Dormibacteria bacterium]